MGTMLMTKSTPRITYKMGIRAGVGALEDESLPWLSLEAPSIEVAADFTCIYRSLMWKAVPGGENREPYHYQSVSGDRLLVRVWQENTADLLLGSKHFAFAAASHKV